MLVSIVIPTFRRQVQLSKLLVELGEQISASGEKLEVIIVDNCPNTSAKATAAAFEHFVKYVSEPRAGISHSRNKGVGVAGGDYVLFIDDDEFPAPGWLAAHIKMALSGCDACFGPVLAEYEVEPPAHLRAPLEKLFTRNIDAPTGANITRLRAYLGTGNSLFDRQKCFVSPTPFDPSLKVGSDVWFIRGLVQDQHIEITWSRDAVVREFVPSSRMTLKYLRERRFRNGQLRSRVEFGGKHRASTVLLMAVGLGQAAAYGAAAGLLMAFDRRRAERLSIALAGGLGKVFWWWSLRTS